MGSRRPTSRNGGRVCSRFRPRSVAAWRMRSRARAVRPRHRTGAAAGVAAGPGPRARREGRTPMEIWHPAYIGMGSNLSDPRAQVLEARARLTGLALTRVALTLPHPGIVARNFVLYPLADIAPDLDLPGLGRVAELKGRVTREGLSLL